MKRLLIAGVVCAVSLPAWAARKPRRGLPKGTAPATQSPRPALERPRPSPEPEHARESAAGGEAPLSLDVSRGAAVVLDAPASGSLGGLGLQNGDVLTHLGAAAVSSGPDAAKTVSAWKPAERLWASVLRDGRAVALETPFVSAERAPARDLAELNPKEQAARQSYLDAAATDKPIAALSYPSLELAAGERLWVRFPKGLPSDLRPGDVVEAETSAPLAADRKLDFLAVAPGSKVWLEAVSASDDGPARAVRLHAYKIALAGGRTYPLSALPASAAGSGDFVRVTPGGTIVTAPGNETRTALGPSWNVQLRLLSPLLLTEPPSYFRAGPGLWVKEVREADVRALEVTLVASGRSAERAGLKAGDRVYSIESNAAARLDFSAALGALYGAPGTDCVLRVTRQGGPRSETLRLKRGVSWRRGFGLRLHRDGDAVSVQEVSEGSPAAKAGITAGMRLSSLAGSPAQGLDRAALRSLLEAEGDAKVEFVFSAPGGRERGYTLSKDWYAAGLSPETVATPFTPAKR
ncbi:MAG: hypothetical protein HY928_01720 [Elusimicrobia bacterium]|nr:hypothetical protein [Elusimicrobiota bacterium]